MPRSLRLAVDGVALHVIQRGNNRAACFLTDNERLVYLAQLGRLSERYDCAVHAYCLLTNHVHLLLTPAAVGSLSALMRDLGQRYVQYFNRRHARTGTLWEGRFRSCIVESERYVLACYRYIELNPVRARMVDHPSGYLWSSFAVNSGMRSDPLVKPHAALEGLAGDRVNRASAYRQLVDAGLDPVLVCAIRDATNAGYPLASERFKETVLAPLGWRLGPEKPGPQALSPSASYAVTTQIGL